MVERDSGWIQIYAENSQEAYDTIIQAFKIAENPEILLPTLVGLDGFYLSHTLENVSILPDETVRNFVGQRKFPLVRNREGKLVPFRLDPENPITIGPLDLYDYYFEHKRQQEEAMSKAQQVVREVHREYAEISGRRYGNGLVEPYMLEDAELATICLGSTAGTVKAVVDQLRAKELKAGLLRIRVFRPFPFQEIIDALQNVRVVAVLDRSCSFGGYGGPVFHEVRHALYDSNIHPYVVNYIYGLGGRDMPQHLVQKIYQDLAEILKTKRIKRPVQFIGLRE
jgi:pyruvate ferredoxin oxidoreductase alpha subunit